jgi:hypothetical protein
MERQINTPLARDFRQIVTAGWANKSDGNVEAPGGHFALVSISDDEYDELVDAVFDGQDMSGQPRESYLGHFIVEEDSDGNTELIECKNLHEAENVYHSALREYNIWASVCPKCGAEGPHEEINGIEPPLMHKCACGAKWDPTGVTRHLHDPLGADHTATFCGARPDRMNLVRQIITNANCEECLAKAEAREEEPDGQQVCDKCGNSGTTSDFLETHTCAEEKPYLVCKGCGESFDDLIAARDHGTFIAGADPTWCGEEGFDLVPESEAL